MKKGFTLIELLVVIAIIALLTSVVLASVASARNKAANSAIQSDLVQVRNQWNLIQDNGITYGDYAGPSCTDAVNASGTVFNADAKIRSQISAALAASGQPGYCGADDNNNWVVVIRFKPLQPSSNWCIDSTGASLQLDLYDTPIPGPATSCSQLNS